MNMSYLKNSIGRYYGYPDCCITEFHTSHPNDFLASKKTNDMKNQYMELMTNGMFSEDKYPELAEFMKLLECKKQELEIKRKASNKTGFIPCKHHAEEIVNGNLRIEDLIKNRKHDQPFPKGSPHPKKGVTK